MSRRSLVPALLICFLVVTASAQQQTPPAPTTMRVWAPLTVPVPMDLTATVDKMVKLTPWKALPGRYTRLAGSHWRNPNRDTAGRPVGTWFPRRSSRCAGCIQSQNLKGRRPRGRRPFAFSGTVIVGAPGPKIGLCVGWAG